MCEFQPTRITVGKRSCWRTRCSEDWTIAEARFWMAVVPMVVVPLRTIRPSSPSTARTALVRARPRFGFALLPCHPVDPTPHGDFRLPSILSLSSGPWPFPFEERRFSRGRLITVCPPLSPSRTAGWPTVTSQWGIFWERMASGGGHVAVWGAQQKNSCSSESICGSIR